MKILRLLVSFAIALLLFGCAELPPKIAKGVEDLSLGVQHADESTRALYTFALSLCDFAPTKEKADQCAAQLKELSLPVRDGFGAIRVAYCTIKPEEPSCKETP